jgi:hypothetical protein
VWTGCQAPHPGGTVVDPHQGFGGIDLAAVAKPPAGVSFYLGQTQRVGTGQSRRRTVSVTSSAARLRIVLAYSDYTGTSLVNDLNLIVTAPDGTAWIGNQPPGGAALDTANNVEVVACRRTRQRCLDRRCGWFDRATRPAALRPRRQGALA